MISTVLTFEFHLNDSHTPVQIHLHDLFNFVTLTRNSEVTRANYSPNENQIFCFFLIFR